MLTMQNNFRAPSTPAEKQIRMIKMILIYVKPIAVVCFIIGIYITRQNCMGILILPEKKIKGD
jgi:hypothetical protein